MSTLQKKLRIFKWLLLWLLFLAPKITLAQAATSTPPSGQGLFTDIFRGAGAGLLNLGLAPIMPIAYGVALLISFIAVAVVTLEGAILGWILDPGAFPIAGLPAVAQGWGIVRDLSNLFFILALVWIALATMLRIETYGARQTLLRLIAAALLVNFSFIIAAAILDFADVITKQFLQPLGQGQGAATRLMDSFRIVGTLIPSVGDAVWNLTFGLFTSFLTASTPNLWIIFNSLTGAIFLLVLMFLLLAAIIFFVIRILYLWILLIFAPLAWVSWIFPASRRLWTQWWSNFLRWTFFAPVFVFFLYLALTILGGINPASFERVILPSQFSGHSTLKPENFMMFILTSGLLIAGLMSANWFSITGASTVMGWGKGLRNFGLGFATRWAARGAKLGGPFKPLQRALDWAGQRPWLGKPGEGLFKRVGTTLAKAVTAPTLGLQWAAGRGAFSPEAWKRTYAAMKARAEGVAFNETSGRLQDTIYAATTLGKRQTAYAERGRQATEQMLGEEITKTARTEEQLSHSINQVALGRTETERATLISLLEKDASINGINTAIHNLPSKLKGDIQADAIKITAKEEADARTAGNTALADEIKAVVDAMKAGGVDQGLFLRTWLQSALGDENRAGRVGNDIGVIARTAGNHSYSGISRFDAGTGQFKWNTYEELQREALGQFKKGQGQLTMRNFHPDSVFMRDFTTGDKTTFVSAAGREVAPGFQITHFREIHQMRPETAEHMTTKVEDILTQFKGAEYDTVLKAIVGLLKSRVREGVPEGPYRVDDKDAPTKLEKRDPRTGTWATIITL